MTPDELRKIMKRRAMRQVDVAWVCGVGVRHVRSWLTKVYPIPQYVCLIMRALDQGRLDAGFLVANISVPQPLVTP